MKRNVLSIGDLEHWRALTTGERVDWPMTTAEVLAFIGEAGIHVSGATLSRIAPELEAGSPPPGLARHWSRREAVALMKFIVSGGLGESRGLLTPAWAKPSAAFLRWLDIPAAAWMGKHIEYLAAHGEPATDTDAPDAIEYYPTDRPWYGIPLGAAMVYDPAAKGSNRLRFVPRLEIRQ